MAAFGSSSMANDNKIGTKAFLLTMWIGYFLIITGAAAIPREELDDMVPVLRSRGYNLIGNAIKTFDLIKDCLALDNLTLFAPTDESMAMAHISGASGLRSHAFSDLFILPSPASLAPNHTLSVTVRVHTSVNGVARALVPSCCLPQSPIRTTIVQTPSRSAYAGPHAFLRPQSASSNGDLYPPDISIGFSISSTVAALTAAAIVACVIIHLFRPRPNLAPLDDNDSAHHFAPLDNDMAGFVLILQMIINTLRWQGTFFVRINDGVVLPVTPERLGVQLRRHYISRLEILTQPQYARSATGCPDDVIMVIEMPDGSSFHLGQALHYFTNSPIYETSYVVSISSVGSPVGGCLGYLAPAYFE